MPAGYAAPVGEVRRHARGGLAATCEGMVRDYLAHRGYGVRATDGWSCDCEDATMRRACLLYLADHGGVDAIRYDVVSIVVAGERQARLCHLKGAWRWAENRGRPGTSEREDRPRKEGGRSGGNPGGRPFPAATAAAKPSRVPLPTRQEHLTTAGRDNCKASEHLQV